MTFWSRRYLTLLDRLIDSKDQRKESSPQQTPVPETDTKPTRKRKRRASANKNASPTAETATSEGTSFFSDLTNLW